ncbi:hypothetical protein Tco_0920087 [Tanacetum coccineum]
MEQMTTICDLVGQVMQKKEEEKRIAEEQAAKISISIKFLVYDDDDDEYSIQTQEYLKKFSSANTLDLTNEGTRITPSDYGDDPLHLPSVTFSYCHLPEASPLSAPTWSGRYDLLTSGHFA